MLESLEERGLNVIDVGVGLAERGDYPVYAGRVVEQVLLSPGSAGLLFCGTGVGMAIAANKYRGIRCVVCSDTYSARMAREHNDANVLALGGRVVGTELALDIVEVFLKSVFEGGRHLDRLRMIRDLE